MEAVPAESTVLTMHERIELKRCSVFPWEDVVMSDSGIG
jgi:hypothetical protein